MDIKAKLNNLRISPRKVRSICDLVRDMDIQEAEVQLDNLNKKAARPVKKLLKSAIANAENNFNITKENLSIKEIRADKGPTMKRYRPRAFGRTTPINKRTTHLTITLVPKSEAEISAKRESDKEKEEEIQTRQQAPTQKRGFAKKTQKDKQPQKSEQEKKDSFFRRKSI